MWGILLTLFTKYGPIPGLLLRDLLPPDVYRKGDAEWALQQRISDYERRLKCEIEELWKKDLPLPSEVHNLDGSHTMFLIRPVKDLVFKYVGMGAVQDIATEYIGYLIGEATTEAGLRCAHEMYRFLLGQPQTRTSASWVFKAGVHRVFQDGGRFQATELGGGRVVEVEMGVQPFRTFSKLSELGRQLREDAGSSNVNPDILGVYFRPQQMNLDSLDSLAVNNSPSRKTPMLVLFQITLGTSHPVKEDELASIWSAMPASLKRTPPILVFVVPAEDTTKFRRQTIEPSDGATPSSFQSWHQYVIPVGSKTLWEAAIPNRNAPGAEPAVNSVTKKRVLRPRSSSPLHAASFLGAKRKASSEEDDSEVKEVGDDDEDAASRESKAKKACKLANPAPQRSTRARKHPALRAAAGVAGIRRHKE